MREASQPGTPWPQTPPAPTPAASATPLSASSSLSQAAVVPPIRVIDYCTGETVAASLVRTAATLDPSSSLGTGRLGRSVVDGELFLERVFQFGNFCGAGMLKLPPGTEKPVRDTEETVLIFFVTEGELEVRICETSFTASQGTLFAVPRGNKYSFRNGREHAAMVLFMQAREVFERTNNGGGSASSSSHSNFSSIVDRVH
ncbi:Mif2/CENP-C like-domain-containing protein [Zopfochytrium polystomum]|nr:Mif2/CENP-C like-domain-containing protein [Zopfochytrium polystomum]